MNETLGLTTLPPEILVNILGSSSSLSPRDLLNFILASKACHQVFSDHRSNILTGILRSSFGPHFPEAVAACRARTVREQDLALWNHRSVTDITARKHREFLRRLTTDFLEGHFASRNVTDRSLREEEGLLTSLEKLWFLVDYFIEEFRCYTSRVLVQTFRSSEIPAVRDGLKELEDVCTEPLSDDEYSRFQKSFVHFELYRRVFASSYKNRISVPPGLQAQIFLKYLWPWEREQLSCIYEFLLVFVSEIHNSMRRDFVDFLKKSHSADVEPSGRFWLTEDVERDIPFCHFTWERADQISSDRDRFASLGLPSLRLFRNADLSGRLLFWKAFGTPMHFPSSQAAYFEEVLTATAEDYNGTLPIETCAEVRGDAFREPPAGWTWARGSIGGEDAGRPEDAALCRIGYVLWDAKRFKQLRFPNPTATFWESIANCSRLEFGVEEEVFDLRVPRSVVQKEYSTLYALPKTDPLYENGWERWFQAEY